MEEAQDFFSQTTLVDMNFAENYLVYWFGVQPTPYNDYLFSNLSVFERIDLLVSYSNSTLSSHPWKSVLGKGYRSRQYQLKLGIDWWALRLPFKHPNSLFIIAGWNCLTNQILLSFLRLSRLKYVLWTDTPNLLRHRHPLFNWLRQTWLKWIFLGATHILGTGTLGVNNLKVMGAPVDRLINFPFFLDLDASSRDLNPRQYTVENPFQFISSGRLLNSLKGHDLAIRALAIVAKASKIPYVYIIAGVGPDEDNLRQLAKKLGLEEQVQFLGWTEPDELRSHYLNADALIHPSPVHDPFPNAVLEGMAASLVVFGSDCSGSVIDRIEHQVNGYIHSGGDVESLASQIIELLNHPQIVVEVGQKARLTSEQWPVSKGVETIWKIASTKCL
jgi:glycosyltransferase involved in cell wall biosynthesis